MKKYVLSNLVVEVTRKCNMSCEHCLRGDAENLDLDFHDILDLLLQVEAISSITFTGGEPSLNVPMINFILTVCRENSIPVGSFFIATNGKENVLPLMESALKWYAYCDEDDCCCLALSQDIFHDEIDKKSIRLLKVLSFFDEDMKNTDFGRIPLINSGRAEDYPVEDKRDVTTCNEELIIDDKYVESLIYLSANGDVRTNCDCAYNDGRFTIGNIRERTLEQILDDKNSYDSMKYAS